MTESYDDLSYDDLVRDRDTLREEHAHATGVISRLTEERDEARQKLAEVEAEVERIEAFRIALAKEANVSENLPPKIEEPEDSK